MSEYDVLRCAVLCGAIRSRLTHALIRPQGEAPNFSFQICFQKTAFHKINFIPFQMLFVAGSRSKERKIHLSENPCSFL